MKTAIDGAGRLVVPKALRDELGLLPGRELDIRAHDGTLVIEPLPTRVKRVRRGRRMVAVPAVRLPALIQDEVRAVLERIACWWSRKHSRHQPTSAWLPYPNNLMLVLDHASWR